MKFRDLDVGKVTVDVAGGMGDWIFFGSCGFASGKLNEYVLAVDFTEGIGEDVKNEKRGSPVRVSGSAVVLR